MNILSTTYTRTVMSLLCWNVSCGLKFPLVPYYSEEVTLYPCFPTPLSLTRQSASVLFFYIFSFQPPQQVVYTKKNQNPKIGLTPGRR
jgi:hypothetical protein